MKLWISGFKGRMGQKISECSKLVEGLDVIGGVDKDFGTYESLDSADILLDFSSVEGNLKLLEYLQVNKVKGKTILVGTTGLDEQRKKSWAGLGKDNKVMVAANTSLGVITLVSVLQQVALRLKDFDIEISETHHRNKKDAPSGTALLLADAIIKKRSDLHINTERNKLREKSEIGMVSMRGGSVFGEHSVRFLADEEELEFSHRALSRDLFAKGSIRLALWLAKQNNGSYTIYDYND